MVEFYCRKIWPLSVKQEHKLQVSISQQGTKREMQDIYSLLVLVG
jgi:hypothetical protein